jgi:formylglycine-generating enzyme required for sulfatase activity
VSDRGPPRRDAPEVSLLDLGLDRSLAPGEARRDAAARPIEGPTDPRVPVHGAARSPALVNPPVAIPTTPHVDGDTELDLRLPDATIPPLGAFLPPPSALVDYGERGVELTRPPGDAPLELARPLRSGAAPRELRPLGPPPLSSSPTSPSRAAVVGSALLAVVAGLAVGWVALQRSGLTPTQAIDRAATEARRGYELVRAQVEGPPVVSPVPPDMRRIEADVTPLGCVGDDEACGADERPPELRSMPALMVDRAEVTLGAYLACVRAGRCAEPGTGDPRCAAREPEGRASWPVNCVSRADAQDFCAYASKRLPTAAEWTHAARAGAGRVFPWGAAAPTCEWANVRGCGLGPRPAGGAETPEGVLDLAGNVAEWVQVEGERAEVRGGGFDDEAQGVRVSRRRLLDASLRVPDVGFRCVR